MKFLFLVILKAFGQESVTLETITVKGTKEDKNYFQSPQSISILQEKDLPAAGRANNMQVLSAVPNVEVNKNGESFSIRGINNTGVTGFQKDNLASLVVDDILQTDLAIQAGSFDLWDMERVEVLRGAQSTSQGVNSLAGSILLDHKKPLMGDEGAARLGLGNFGHREVGLVVNKMLVQDKIALRTSLGKEANDGYISNVTTKNDKWGQWNKDRAALGVSYQVSEQDLVSLNLKFHQNDQGGTYTQGVDAFRYEVAEDQDYKSITSNQQIGLSYEKDFSDQSVNTVILGFSKSGQTFLSDADGTSLNTAGTRVEGHQDHFYSFENRWVYKTEKSSNLLGLHAHEFRLKDNYEFNLLFPLGTAVSTPVAVGQSMDRTRKAYAIFNSFTYKWNEYHSGIFGLRGEQVEASFDTNISGVRLRDLGGTNTTVDSYIKSISGSYGGPKSNFVVLPRIGYLFSSGIHHSGLTYTRGYRTAGVSVNRRRATIVEYNPEFTDNYELSYKYAGSDFQISSNVFYIDWRDQQVQVQMSSDVYDTQVQNAAKSQVSGAEVEGSFLLTSFQVLKVGVGYTDTKFNDFQTRSGKYDGNQFPFASHWTGRIAHDMRATDNLSFMAILRSVSESYSNAENTRSSDAQFYVDWNAKYILSSWVMEGYVNNLLDGQYRIFDGTAASTTSPYKASYHQVSTPREGGLRLSYYW